MINTHAKSMVLDLQRLYTATTMVLFCIVHVQTVYSSHECQKIHSSILDVRWVCTHSVCTQKKQLYLLSVCLGEGEGGHFVPAGTMGGGGGG